MPNKYENSKQDFFDDYIKNAKENCKSLEKAISKLQSMQDDLVDQDTLDYLVDCYKQYKEFYNQVFKAGMKALLNLENPKERDVLYYTYFEAMKHSDVMKLLNMKKQTYWNWHKKAIEHYNVPDIPEPPELPEKME